MNLKELTSFPSEIIGKPNKIIGKFMYDFRRSNDSLVCRNLLKFKFTLLVFLQIHKKLKLHKLITLGGFIFADRKINGILLRKNLAGSSRDRGNTH